MTQSKIVGELHTAVHGCEIRKWIYGYTYPRNGNVANPTPKVLWVVYKNGINQGKDAKLAGAKELAKMIAEDTK